MTYCQKCGTALPADAPAGQCPKCLVMAGLHGDDFSQPGETLSSPAASGFRAPSVKEISSRFPQLEILELLGKGGMGAVYKARQRGLDRLVAVKILPPEIGNDGSFAERFAREARALARLNHTNIVTVYDFGQTSPQANTSTGQAPNGDNLFYIVMEFVDGVNLRQTIQAGGLQPGDALAIVPQICEALQFAHDEGIVHRDIKPENILIDKKGRVKIADFGLAKLLGSAPAEPMLTGSHQIMGTMRYMAPEQMQGSAAVDHRADIYSLGVVFYEMLTGEIPMGRFAPPSQKVQLDVRLDEVVLRSLAREPERRYQQASQIKTDVDNISSNAESPVQVETKKPNAVIEVFETLVFPVYAKFVLAGFVLAGYLFWALPEFGLGLGIFYLFHVLLSFGSMRSVSLDQRGLTMQRVFGPDKFQSWKDVVRVTPISRLQVFRQMIFGHETPSSGPAIGFPVKHYFRIDGRDGCWFFCPKHPYAFVDAIVSHGCLVDARKQPESRPRSIESWLVLALLIFVLFVLTILFVTRFTRPEQQGPNAAIAPGWVEPHEPVPSWEKGSWNGWVRTKDGIALDESFVYHTLKLDWEQNDEVNLALTSVYMEYLVLESQNSEYSVSENGRAVTTIRPFPEEVEELKDRLWTKLDAILNVEQQKAARSGLRLRPPGQLDGMPVRDCVAPGFFGWGEDGATIETWSVGAWKHWRIQTRGFDFSSESPELPVEYQRFWKEP